MIQAIIGSINVFPLIGKNTFLKLGMVAHVYNLINRETEARGWMFEGYPLFHNKTSSFKTAF